MVLEDLVQVGKALSDIRDPVIRKILLLSPNKQQYELFKKTCRGARIYCSDKYSWDLFERKTWSFDLIFAGNVMMYSPAPAIWFENILLCSRLFLVQDLINRRRSNIPPYLGSDHDVIRYQFRERGVISEFSGAYDLGLSGAHCECFAPYRANGDALHFVALFRGASNKNSLSNNPISLSLRRSTLWFRLTSGGFGRA